MSAHICILMGTWNGARHLQAQLESFLAQSHADWSLYISDDGSQDATRQIVEQFAARHPDHNVHLMDGPGQGSAANFLSLLAHADLPEGAWVALSDQDDVWFPDRLEHALGVLEAQDKGHPRAYASRTMLTDEALVPRRVSRHRPRPPTFGNALVQNVLAGNTLVLDPVAVAVLRRTASAALRAGVPHHDWWIYLLMTGVGAQVVNDDRPGLYYRQHDRNLLGANRGGRKALGRFGMIWGGQYGGWIDRNLSALQQVAPELTGESRAMLEAFAAWKAGAGRGWCGGGLRRIGVQRQSVLGDVLLRIAAVFGRV